MPCLENINTLNILATDKVNLNIATPKPQNPLIRKIIGIEIEL